MLSVAQAFARIHERVRLLPTETAPLRAAAHRVLATDVVAARALPPYDNSAMDGFAVRAADVPATLPIAGTVAAGDAPDAVLGAGTALRIMTGAPMPRGADCVIMREDVEDLGDSARFPAAAAGRHIRRAGEDMAVGALAAARGTRLDAGTMGLLAALGAANVSLSRAPRVAILSTGDELVEVDVEPRPGQIVSSNEHVLAAQVTEAGGVALCKGIVRDDRRAVVAALAEALHDTDVLVTSGGVSVGDYDFVKEALSDLGIELDFWKVAMKPGKPLAFGVSGGGTLVFGLPGNPVSSMVVFELFVRPTLLAMQGARRLQRPRVRAVLPQGYRKSPSRAHFVCATLDWSGPEPMAQLRTQGSGSLSSMAGIDALVEIPAEVEQLPPGATALALLVRHA